MGTSVHLVMHKRVMGQLDRGRRDVQFSHRLGFGSGGERNCDPRIYILRGSGAREVWERGMVWDLGIGIGINCKPSASGRTSRWKERNGFE